MQASASRATQRLCPKPVYCCWLLFFFSAPYIRCALNWTHLSHKPDDSLNFQLSYCHHCSLSHQAWNLGVISDASWTLHPSPHWYPWNGPWTRVYCRCLNMASFPTAWTVKRLHGNWSPPHAFSSPIRYTHCSQSNNKIYWHLVILVVKFSNFLKQQKPHWFRKLSLSYIHIWNFLINV